MQERNVESTCVTDFLETSHWLAAGRVSQGEHGCRYSRACGLVEAEPASLWPGLSWELRGAARSTVSILQTSTGSFLLFASLKMPQK